MQNLFNKRKAKIDSFNEFRKKKDFIPKEIPEDLFKSCPHCNIGITYNEWLEGMYVCPRCGYHTRISAHERIRQLCDESSFYEIDGKEKSLNEDNFEGYDEKLDKAQRSTGLNEAVVCGIGKINNLKTVLCVMDSNFMMGSMGSVVGEKITKSIEYATSKKLPIIIVTTSGGARMQEGIMSLMQMAKTSAALKRHSDKGLLYITIISDPTTGGVSASFAMLGDIIIAEPNALIGFAGKRVIEKTVNETLPPQFQRSEFMLEKGFIDLIVERKYLKNTISKLLDIHGVK